MMHCCQSQNAALTVFLFRQGVVPSCTRAYIHWPYLETNPYFPLARSRRLQLAWLPLQRYLTLALCQPCGDRFCIHLDYTSIIASVRITIRLVSWGTRCCWNSIEVGKTRPQIRRTGIGPAGQQDDGEPLPLPLLAASCG